MVSLLLLPPAVLASNCQTVDGSDTSVKEVNVARADLTRIAIDGGRIASLKYKQSDLTAEADKSTGQVFVQPVDPKEPRSVFVVSSSGMTHSLILKPVDSTLECVVIREPKAEKPAPATVPTSRAPEPAKAPVTELQGAVQRLMVAMARRERPQGVEIKAQEKELALWNEAKLLLIGTYKARGLTGEAYRLTNVSKAPIRLAEQEFYRPGVIAVGIELHELAPGEQTDLFVVVTGGDQ